MRIEYDREADALYVYVDEQALDTGKRARTVEIIPVRIYADVDAQNRPLGIEFLSLEAFNDYLKAHDGLNVPNRITGPESLLSQRGGSQLRRQRGGHGRGSGVAASHWLLV